jgi:hypothetical protein
MNRLHVHDFSEKELVLNAIVDAPILDEDAWEDATDESDFDCEVLCHSQSRWSTRPVAWFDVGDQP